MGNSSSIVFLKILVAHQVWQQLAQLCLTMETKAKDLLPTQGTLFKLLENDHKVSNSQRLEIGKFFLLITLKLNVRLHQKKAKVAKAYQVSVFFARDAIIEELIQLANQTQTDKSVINALKTEFIAKLTKYSDSSTEFIFKTVK